MRSNSYDAQGHLYASPIGGQEGAHPLNPALLPLIGVAIYMATSLFYIFPSGNPQPADLALVATILATITCVWRRFPNQPLLFLACALLPAWVIVVNAVWYLMIGEFAFIKNSMFYVYNMLVFFFGVTLYYHDPRRLKTVLYWSLIAAAIIQALYLELVASGGAARAIGTFNNPNQLGYWGLLILACFAILKEREPLGFIDVGFLICAAYAVIRSLSKAATLSGALLVLMIIVFCRFKKGSGKVLGVLFVTILVAEGASGGYFGFFEGFTSAKHIESLERRLGGIGTQNDDDVTTRGYYRIVDNPHLIAFGAGEAVFSRIDRYGSTKEFHSTLGNLLMSYGIVGLGLFFFILAIIFARAHVSSLAYFVPLMTYGVTHNGIRDSLLWFFLALVFGQSRYGSDPGRPLISLFQPRPAPVRGLDPPGFGRPPARPQARSRGLSPGR